jgi:eukaryotic-like serine/threonine-protein kinase
MRRKSLPLVLATTTTTIFSLSLSNIQNCLSISQDSTTKLVTITMPPPSYLDILSNNNNSAATINPTFSTYENPTYGVKIQYPSNWQKMDFDGHHGNNSLPIAGFIPPSENDSGLLENLVIVVKKLHSQSTSLKQFADSLVSSYKSNLHNFQLIELNPLTTPALNSAYKIEYTHSSDMLMLKTMVVVTISGGIAYMISYNADSSDFSNYLPIIQKMIDSLQLQQQILRPRQ